MKNKPYLVNKHVFLARMSVGDSTKTLPPMFKGVGGVFWLSSISPLL